MKKIIIYWICLFVNIILLQARPVAAETMDVFDSETGLYTSLEIDPNLTSIEGDLPSAEKENVPLSATESAPETENWVQVDGRQYPYSSVVYINYRGNCSGTLIGPYTVLTAAHCFPLGPNTDPAEIRVNAGGEETAQKAKGVRLFLSVHYGMYKKEHYDNETATYDWAVIVLNKPLGKKNGYLGVKAVNLQAGDSIHVVGFPGDKIHNRPWHSWGEITAVLQDSNTFYHTAPTAGGNSGGPVLVNEDPGSIVGLATFIREEPYRGGGTLVCEKLLSFVAAHRNDTPQTN